MTEEQEQNRLTEARYAVRRYLYARPLVAQDAATISHGLRVKGHNFDQSEVEVALHFWAMAVPPQVMIVRRSMADPTKHFQITTEGVVEFEAGR